uniref:Uncharacterized protein LOC111108172 isoform X1 n=1 Tax=Crassostrea virginica TaxID=6565 RepID=A0A8B8B9U3_CRAVI|nr:uncharacterized protein LOC111108172 isoform X1 [Crassostrea virginica]
MMFQLRKKPCAFEKLDWEIDKRNFSCTSSINVYHCIQDERNRSGEICIQPVWVQPHYCPEFNTGARALDTVPCNVTKGCPDVTFLSDEAYKYPVCLNKTHKKEILENGDSSVPSWFWIVVPTVVLGIVILVLSAACLVWRRKRKDQNDENRDQPLLDLEDEFEKSKPFHKTAAFHEAIRYLKNDGKLLVLIGIWGSGKTKTAKEVYRSVTGKSPLIITDLNKFEDDNQAFIFDEAIPEDLSNGDMKLLQGNIKKWLTKLPNVKSKTFIIFTLHEDRKSTLDKLTSAAYYKNWKVINLNDRLTKGDRTQILNSHFTKYCPKKDFSKIEDLATEGKHESLGYPEICALFCRCEIFQGKKGTEFCKKPLHFLKLHLEDMYQTQENKFLILVYMSLKNMEIDVENPDEMLFQELETCRSNNQTETEPFVNTLFKIVQRGKVDDIQSLMPLEFVDKIPGTTKYRLQHKVIKRMTLIVFGTSHFYKLLALSERKDTEGWIIKNGIFKEETPIFGGEIYPRILVDQVKWKSYKNKYNMNTTDKKVELDKPDDPCSSKCDTELPPPPPCSNVSNTE